jgi:hypothetical protein
MILKNDSYHNPFFKYKKATIAALIELSEKKLKLSNPYFSGLSLSRE